MPVDDAVVHCQRLLSEKGRLSTAISGFVPRQEQVELAIAIVKAIKERKHLIAEAGTGTGKTFAYLVPCLTHSKKTILSTATKTLQDQLFQKDIPMLIKALGLSTRVQNLKGRANYLCRYRLALHAEEGRFLNPDLAHEIAYVREKLPQFVEGERSELPEISEDSPIWPYVTSTAENCLGAECKDYQDCFLMKARKRALDADLVVINHHLFFADSRLKEEGFGELLPGAEVVVFDEAHQLAEIAANFKGVRVSTKQIRDLLDDILREWPVLDLANQPLKSMSFEANNQIDSLFSTFPKREERVAFAELINIRAFQESWQSLLDLVGSWNICLKEAAFEKSPGLARCAKRIEELEQLLANFGHSEKAQILWVERFKHSLVFHATPFDVAESFNSLISKEQCAYIFTSATLTMASSFDCFIKPLGLSNSNTICLPSPFDFQKQALLYLPRDLPDPKDSRYYEELLKKALPVIEACRGRCFFLFTSHKALKLVADLLGNTLNYPLLIQGEEAKPILLARFRALGNAVLLGTSTFWEGVDVKGEALSCVIIDKLPFANPFDPVVRGKMLYLRSKGLSDFEELSLPNAVLALKQGVGRLIRDVSDKGVLVIADPRLTARAYGQKIFASLPNLKKTRDERTVLQFIDSLALKNELISV